jgi:hypothetical protein
MSDVNAAAERWRLDNKAEEHKEYARSPYKGNFDLRLEDAYLLADAYLAEHPADDGEAIRTMEMKPTGRGFAAIYCKNYPKFEQARLVQESSAIREYDDAMNNPGSSCLWVGDDFHLNREQVRELVGVLQHWLRNKTLRNY